MEKKNIFTFKGFMIKLGEFEKADWKKNVEIFYNESSQNPKKMGNMCVTGVNSFTPLRKVYLSPNQFSRNWFTIDNFV
jgi:hypothetical protein